MLLTIVVGVLFSVGAFKNDDDLSDVQNVVRVTAGALSAVALAVLIELVALRARDIDSREVLEDLVARVSDVEAVLRPPVDSVLLRREQLQPWTQNIQGCDELAMSGLSLRTFTKENLGSVRRMLQAGGTCRFLLLAPESPASALVARNFLAQDDPQEYDGEVQASITRLAALRQQWPHAVGLRTLEHLPASSITLIRSSGDETSAFVELYTEEESSVGRPHLQLSPSTSPLWFAYFAQQFEILWDRGADVPAGVT